VRRKRSEPERREQLALDDIDNGTRPLAIDDGDGQAADSENLIRPNRAVVSAGHVILIDDVEEARLLGVPKTLVERVPTGLIQREPFRIALPHNLQRVEPQRLNLHRLANSRRDFAAVHASVHPGQLHARLSRREQTVDIGVDVVPRALCISLDDLVNRALQACAIRTADNGGVYLIEQIVDRDDEPQRRVDGVEFRLFAGIGEPIRQHAVGDGTCPFEQDVSRLSQPSRRDAQTADRDERVSAPVGEPRITGHDSASAAPAYEIRVRGAIEWRRKRGSALSL
jgi:hypothetical protein